MSDLYEYGPPTTVGEGAEDSGLPQDNTGDVEDADGGDTPHTPPANTDTVVEPGGSPSDEALSGADPSITTLTPDNAVVGADATVTVTGSMFSEDSVVEADQVAVATTHVSNTELSATLPDPGTAGTVSVTVRNPNVQQESNSVSFTFTATEDPLLTQNIREDSK